MMDFLPALRLRRSCWPIVRRPVVNTTGSVREIRPERVTEVRPNVNGSAKHTASRAVREGQRRGQIVALRRPNVPPATLQGRSALNCSHLDTLPSSHNIQLSTSSLPLPPQHPQRLADPQAVAASSSVHLPSLRRSVWRSGKCWR